MLVKPEVGYLVNGFDGSKIFDDSDNPLTKARIDSFRSESASWSVRQYDSMRVVVALATLPKLALKGLAMPLRVLGKAPAVGGLASKGAKGILAADDAIKATRTGTKATTTALNAIQKGAPNSKVAKLANADDWLKLTYKDVVNAGVEGQQFAFGMRTVERAAKGLTKGKASVRNVSEALAWDAFRGVQRSG